MKKETTPTVFGVLNVSKPDTTTSLGTISANQLRELHIDMLKAIKKAEWLLLDNPQFKEGSFARDYAWQIIKKLESSIFNELFNIKDCLEIDWKAIDEKEI